MAIASGGMGGGLVGTTLSRRFRITRRIGGGGMGDVYAAEPVSGGRPVAIKVLRAEYVSDGEVYSRFLDEAHTCQKLVHPNIVHALETGKAEDGTPYIVMELIDGVPVVAYTQGGGRIPLAQAVGIVQGILSGLTAAHAHGVIHRDLKPENVLLTRGTNGQFVVKLLDFGIAKVMDAATGSAHKTQSGAVLGTAQYMSPEQVRSASDVDGRADLWSVGVMFYEMLTGREPFPASTPYARFAAVVGTEPEPIAEKHPELAPLSAFMEKALAKDRAKRFQTAQEMSLALTAALGGAARAGDRLSQPSSGQYALLTAQPTAKTLTSPAVASAEPDIAPPPRLKDPALQVEVAPPRPEPLVAAPLGVPVAVVAGLVALALLLGFIGGFLVGRGR